MKNPYWNRKMIREPEHFFGRKKEIKHILAGIGAPHPQNISIIGERKIGKSSLLYYILKSDTARQELPHPEEYIFAFVDFQQCLGINMDEFWRKVYSELKSRLPNEIKIEKIKNIETFASVVQYLNNSNYKLILLFDEFDKILQNKNFGVDFFHYLRSLTNRYDVAYILSTKRNLEDISREDLLGSPFFNIFTPIHLELFQKNEALELIRYPSANEGIPLEEESEFILKNAGLFPFFIQLLCFDFFEWKEEHPYIDQKDYEHILEKFRIKATPFFRNSWRSLSQEERDLLVKIAKRKEMKTRNRDLIIRVKQKGYITIDKKTEIFSNIFQNFILENSKYVKGDEDGISEEKLSEDISWYRHILKGILSAFFVILLGILSNWLYEHFFSEEKSAFIRSIGEILSIFSFIADWSFLFFILSLLIVTIILFFRSKY